MPIPTVKRGARWLLEQPGAYDLGLAFFTGVVGLSSATAQYSQGHHRLAAVLTAATVSALVVGFAKSTVTLVLARRKESTQDLEGCLYTLHSLLTPEWDDGNVRLAIHVPVGGNELEQVPTTSALRRRRAESDGGFRQTPASSARRTRKTTRSWRSG